MGNLGLILRISLFFCHAQNVSDVTQYPVQSVPGRSPPLGVKEICLAVTTVPHTPVSVCACGALAGMPSNSL